MRGTQRKSSPTLILNAKPGGVQVFIDDELIARTNLEGHLKLSGIAPGRHTLRVSLEGYNDAVQIIDLAPGAELRTLQPW